MMRLGQSRIHKLRVSRYAIGDLGRAQIASWNALVPNTVQQSPFLTYDFARAVRDVRGDAFVLHIQEGDGAQGFVPFQTRFSVLGHAEKIGSNMSDHFGVVGDIKGAIDFQQVLAKAGLSSLRFDHGDPDICRFGFVNEEVSAGVRTDLANSKAYIDGLSTRDKQWFSSMSRKGRKLEREIGPLKFEWHTARAPAALEWLVRLKSEQYARTGVGDVLSTGWKASLLERLLAEPDTSLCRPVFSTLTAGDHLVAACLNLRQASVLHVWFPVYDLTYQKYSPGQLLFLRTFEAATTNDISVVDFGAGFAEYKSRYGTSTYDVLSGVVRRPTLYGHLDRAMQSLEWRIAGLKHRARSVLSKPDGMPNAG